MLKQYKVKFFISKIIQKVFTLSNTINNLFFDILRFLSLKNKLLKPK